MKKELAEFFEKKKIEYYSVLDYSVAREINHAIIERESFKPKSAIIFLLPYYAGEGKNLSAYAAARDYHIAIREHTCELIEELQRLFPECRARGYGDHSPIDERDAALSAGLGILGDSGLLINEKYGTYIFIADVLTDIPSEELGESGAGLSAITQRKGDLTEDEVDLMRKFNTVWGCDICQSACPYNKEPKITPISFFLEDRITTLTSERLSEMSKDEFAQRAFAWRGRKTVERNLKLLDY